MCAGASAAGSIFINSARYKTAFFILFLAEPGCVLTPLKVIFAPAALKFSYSIPPSSPPSTVYAKSASKVSKSNLSAPLPISSSGVKQIEILPWQSSASSQISRHASIISATPALSSAPRSVVRSVTIISSPEYLASIIGAFVPSNFIIFALTSFPLTSGDVSI